MAKVYLIHFKQDTEENLRTQKTILRAGEPGFATDTRVFKIGDGITEWSLLPKENASSSLGVKNYIRNYNFDENLNDWESEDGINIEITSDENIDGNGSLKVSKTVGTQLDKKFYGSEFIINEVDSNMFYQLTFDYKSLNMPEDAKVTIEVSDITNDTKLEVISSEFNCNGLGKHIAYVPMKDISVYQVSFKFDNTEDAYEIVFDNILFSPLNSGLLINAVNSDLEDDDCGNLIYSWDDTKKGYYKANSGITGTREEDPELWAKVKSWVDNNVSTGLKNSLGTTELGGGDGNIYVDGVIDNDHRLHNAEGTLLLNDIPFEFEYTEDTFVIPALRYFYVRIGAGYTGSGEEGKVLIDTMQKIAGTWSSFAYDPLPHEIGVDNDSVHTSAPQYVRADNAYQADGAMTVKNYYLDSSKETRISNEIRPQTMMINAFIKRFSTSKIVNNLITQGITEDDCGFIKYSFSKSHKDHINVGNGFVGDKSVFPDLWNKVNEWVNTDGISTGITLNGDNLQIGSDNLHDENGVALLASELFDSSCYDFSVTETTFTIPAMKFLHFRIASDGKGGLVLIDTMQIHEHGSKDINFATALTDLASGLAAGSNFTLRGQLTTDVNNGRSSEETRGQQIFIYAHIRAVNSNKIIVTQLPPQLMSLMDFTPGLKSIDELIITNNADNPTTEMDITFNGLQIGKKYVTGFSQTIDLTNNLDISDLATSGNDKVYYIWIATNGITTKCLFSLSCESLVVEDSFTEKRCIGTIFVETNDTIMPSGQRNKTIMYSRKQVTEHDSLSDIDMLIKYMPSYKIVKSLDLSFYCPNASSNTITQYYFGNEIAAIKVPIQESTHYVYRVDNQPNVKINVGFTTAPYELEIYVFGHELNI